MLWEQTTVQMTLGNQSRMTRKYKQRVKLWESVLRASQSVGW